MARALAASASPSSSESICFGIGKRLCADGFEVADLRPELPEEAVEAHGHDEAHFVLVLEGHYLSSAAGMGDATVGPLLIYNPAGTMHRDRFRGDRGRFVAFGLPSAATPVSVGLPDIPLRLGEDVAAVALRAAAAMRRSDADVAGLCLDLIAATAPCRAKRQPDWVARAKAMLEESGERAPLVSDVAAEVGVHPVHLARVFRAATGCSPGEYHLFRRVVRARALIGSTKLPLAEVALRAGFGDQSHLTRIFTGRFGISPAAYRAALSDVANRQDAPLPMT